jgi:formamidopyrimidine-DNA glycosylase-like protein
MPEGDSIFRAAGTLDRALAGRTVTRFESVFPRLTRIDRDHPFRGRVLQRVVPRGKHILMWFSGDLILHTHMRMKGSWHLYRPGERGCAPDALLDQRAVAGIGNIYKPAPFLLSPSSSLLISAVVVQDPLQKLFAGTRVRKAFFVRHRQVGQRVDERLRKEPASLPFDISIVNRHAVDAATGRSRLEDVPREIERNQRVRPLARPRVHALGPVAAAADADEPDDCTG